MSNGDSVFLFLAGVGVGAAAVLLCSPASGSETRARIGKRAGETGAYLKQQAAAMQGPLQEAAAQGEQVVHAVVSDARDLAQDAANVSREMAHQAGAAVEKSGKLLQEI